MGASNEKLLMFCESLRKMFLKLSFWTFAIKFTNLVIKFQITGPLYYADSFPTLYSTLGISICNLPLRDGLLTNFKLKGGYKTL